MKLDRETGMTVKDLIATLQSIADHSPGHPDYRVRIKTSQPAMPASPTAGISHVQVGIDWNHGQVIITPEIPLVPKPKTKKRRRDEWEEEKSKLNAKVNELRSVIARSIRVFTMVQKGHQLDGNEFEEVYTYKQSARESTKI